jgi:hypothetical protein
MGCFLALLARIGVLVMWLGTTLVIRAFDGAWFLPMLGLIFLPITTLAYVAVFATAGDVTGWVWLWVVLGFLFDLGLYSSAGYSNRQGIRGYAAGLPRWPA